MRKLIFSIFALGISLGGLSGYAEARETVISENSEDVNITIYRDTGRGERPINNNWPRGYALITEKRNIVIPKGESQIRFEGVSEGMLPESAIVSGLPNGVVEKNRDERLLSPYGLVDSYLKRRVTIIRTSAATGKTTEKDVFITAGPNGGVIFESDEGFEALRCTGLPERILYDRVPDDLSAKPTLSVITESDHDVTATVTLTYLAQGFDWQANYIANVDPDTPQSPNGDKKMNLFAWLTVANGGNQSFDGANLMAIAGTPNRENVGQQIRPTGQGLNLQCWPQGRTDQIPLSALALIDALYEEADIVSVRKERSFESAPVFAPPAALKAEQENLGDLKLYRIPERVDVKAKGQKQVAMIVQPDAQYRRIFIANAAAYSSDSRAVSYILRSKNTDAKGLGLPLPAGQFAVFEKSNFGSLLVGEGAIEDSAIGNKVELQMPTSPDVQMTHIKTYEKKRKSSYRITISNALDHAIDLEVSLDLDTRMTKNITKIDGVPTWSVRIPANEDTALDYNVQRPKP